MPETSFKIFKDFLSAKISSFASASAKITTPTPTPTLAAPAS